MSTLFWILMFAVSVLAVLAWFIVSLVLVIRTPKEKVGLKVVSIVMLVMSGMSLLTIFAVIMFIIVLLSGAVSLM